MDGPMRFHILRARARALDGERWRGGVAEEEEEEAARVSMGKGVG